MPNWSLVSFTLLIQSSIGLVWVGALGQWFGRAAQAAFWPWHLLIALVLSGLGVCLSLAHLARPGLAPHAVRNLAGSWLSREVVLVPAFIAAVAFSILALLLDGPGWSRFLEIVACLLGGIALHSMIRVYRLKTVPAWNSPATPREFTGSVLMLGGGLSTALTAFTAAEQSGWSPGVVTAGIGILAGLVLKVAAIPPSLAAERVARVQTWYDPIVTRLTGGQVIAARLCLSLAGLTLVAMSASGISEAWLVSCLALSCLVAGEVMGRFWFYSAYGRIGV